MEEDLVRLDSLCLLKRPQNYGQSKKYMSGSKWNIWLLFVAGSNLWCPPNSHITPCTSSLISFLLHSFVIEDREDFFPIVLIDFTTKSTLQLVFPLVVFINLFYIFAVSWYAFSSFPVIVVVWSLGCSHTSFHNWKLGNLYLPSSYLIVFLCLCQLSTSMQVAELSEPTSLEVKETICSVVHGLLATLSPRMHSKAPDLSDNSSAGTVSIGAEDSIDLVENTSIHFQPQISLTRDYLARLLFWWEHFLNDLNAQFSVFSYGNTYMFKLLSAFELDAEFYYYYYLVFKDSNFDFVPW